MRSESLDAVDRSGRTLRVEFVWRGDRFGHAICAIRAGGEAVPLLESLEGTAADDWPPSPPLQSLHRETFANGRQAILLVGAAGRSHWSASVEAGNDPAELIFDIACRSGGAAAPLGSEYLADPRALSLLRVQPQDGQLVIETRRLCIAPNPTSSPTARWRYAVRLLETER